MTVSSDPFGDAAAFHDSIGARAMRASRAAASSRDTAERPVSIALHKFLELRDTLHYLAQHHHNQLGASRLHDPEHRAHFEGCPCLTCKRAADVLYRCVPDGWDEGARSPTETPQKGPS